MKQTKKEISARIDELKNILNKLFPDSLYSQFISSNEIVESIHEQINQLKIELEAAPNDIFKAVLESHEVLCKVKNMGEKDAYGQNPGIYYSLAVAGESGELGNKIVKAVRNGNNEEAIKQAVISELPDVIIYAAVLAHVFDLDLNQLVNDKVDIVTKRALDGYYGGPLDLKK